MKEILLKEILESIALNLKLKFNNVQDINPTDLNRTKYNLTRIWFGVLYAHKIEVLKHQTHCPISTNLVKESYYAGNTLIFEDDLISQHLNEIVSQYQKLASINITELNLSDLYETILNYEWNIYEGFNFVDSKGSKKRSGSYYTPTKLATVAIEKQLSSFVENKNNTDIKKSFEEFTVIDFSCGTGSFLINYLQFVIDLNESNNLCIDIFKVLKNIYAVDVDFIALEIAKIEMALTTGTYDLVYIEKNYILGNPLLNKEISYISKRDKYSYSAAGYIYHDKLAITIEEEKNFPPLGFDLIIGNPPWEKIRLEEKNFFAPWSKSISKANKKDLRNQAIEELACHSPKIYGYYLEFKTQIDKIRKQIKKSFNFTGVGELNTYALFTELAINYKSDKGIIIYLVKSALVISKVYSSFFKELLKQNLLYSSHDFINTNKIFDIDSRERFVLLVLKENNGVIRFKANLTEPNDIFKEEIILNSKILSLLNPETNMLPNIRNDDELLFIKKIYENNKVFSEEFPNVNFGRLVHFTSHASQIIKEHNKDTIPVYEGKFIDIYDGKYSTFAGVAKENKYVSKAQSRTIDLNEKSIIDYVPESRFFIKKEKWIDLTKNYNQEFSLIWRSLTSASNRRTMISTLLPHQPTSQSIQFLQTSKNEDLIFMLAVFNSITFDYIVRLKLSGIDMTQAIIKQMPVPSKSKLSNMLLYKTINATYFEHIETRIQKLYENDIRLCNYPWININQKIKVSIDSYERKKIIADLDLIIGKMYGLQLEELKCIAKEFNKFYNENEITQFFDIEEGRH